MNIILKFKIIFVIVLISIILLILKLKLLGSKCRYKKDCVYLSDGTKFIPVIDKIKIDFSPSVINQRELIGYYTVDDEDIVIKHYPKKKLRIPSSWLYKTMTVEYI